MAEYLENIFQDQGYETISAADVEEGYRLLIESKPDLVTLDLQMPGEHGAKFYQKFRKHENSKDTPIIVITGQTAPHRSIREDKVAAIVRKPFEPDVLAA